jgi:hypothetical protein
MIRVFPVAGVHSDDISLQLVCMVYLHSIVNRKVQGKAEKTHAEWEREVHANL